MFSTRLESVSNKENINPTGCQGKRFYKKTKALPFAVMPISAKVKESQSASTLRIRPLAEQHVIRHQHSLGSLDDFVALDGSLFSQSADSRARDLTESPLAEVTDAFTCMYCCFHCIILTYQCSFESRLQDDPYASMLISTVFDYCYCFAFTLIGRY